MDMLEINTNNFFKEVEEYNNFIILDFYSTYCVPCNELEKEIEQIDLNDIKICKINIDNELELAIKYGIMSVPTIIFLKNNKILEKINGFIPKEELIKKINKLK